MDRRLDPAVPGAHSEGRTRDEARENVLDALRLMLSPEPESATDPAGSEPLELSVLSKAANPSATCARPAAS